MQQQQHWKIQQPNNSKKSFHKQQRQSRIETKHTTNLTSCLEHQQHSIDNFTAMISVAHEQQHVLSIKSPSACAYSTMTLINNIFNIILNNILDNSPHAWQQQQTTEGLPAANIKSKSGAKSNNSSGSNNKRNTDAAKKQLMITKESKENRGPFINMPVLQKRLSPTFQDTKSRCVADDGANQFFPKKVSLLPACFYPPLAPKSKAKKNLVFHLLPFAFVCLPWQIFL